jgi:uroporphyrin-III C-methyltransferase / precorrin-2 dehydrogenase / sirohydrochlorin ferrochelatase
MLRHALRTFFGHWRAADRPAVSAQVALVGAGPGDPELLTVGAQRLIAEADVVIHDRLVSEAILAQARRGARLIAVGKVPYGQGWSQDAINALIVTEARRGGRVVRLKGGDPVVFGRLDDEIEALEAAGIAYRIVPGVTAASAAAAAIGQSLTRRGRNGALRILTGHDVNGFAEQDWRALAAPGTTAAIYMGVKAATFLRGRLLMHGAHADVAVTAVENASRPDERVIATTLMNLPVALAAAAPVGPVLILLGLAPRQAAAALPRLREAL